MPTSSLRHESFRVNPAYNLLAIVVYDTKKCRGLLKHVLKPYDTRNDRQFCIVEIVYDFSMTRVARAIKVACDNRKQKSYRVNRPLKPYDNRSDRQFYIVEIVHDFSMTRAARAIKITCDNRKQKSNRVNRP